MPVAILASSFDAGAQYVTRKPKDSLVNATAKTISFPSTPNNVLSIGFIFTKSTGTPAGTAILETRIDTIRNVWEHYNGSDTFTITNIDSGVHIWPLLPTNYGNGLRIRFTPSGTQKTYINVAYLRRQ